MKTVLLAGNPNVGKSTLFNGLTGLRQHTGNWSGKTVEIASGMMRQGKDVLLVDLPGMYSLYGKSEDEKVAAECILASKGDGVVVVCDSCCLERNLILALQIMNYRNDVILCVNLMDEAERRGVVIDEEKLERSLGIPVVFTAGGKRKGLTKLKELILTGFVRSGNNAVVNSDPVETAKKLVAACVKREPKDANWLLVLDRLLVDPRRGGSILALLTVLILWLTIRGANYPSTLLTYFFDWFHHLFLSLMNPLPAWLTGILLDGVYATASQVIAVMLPPLLIFFPLFTLLEDVGYLPRLAFLLERGMHRCGGCGKQALTLCMGLGCNAVGVTGCRIISSPKQRLAAILTNAMIPCNGRFPTLIFLGTLFFGSSGGAFLVAGCVALAFIVAMLSTRILTSGVLRHYSHEEAFFMEIPPLRCPQLRNVLISSLLDRTLRVAGRALLVAAPAGAILWLLRNSAALMWLSNTLEPLGNVLGMDGKILAGFLLSFPANELFLPILLMIIGGNATFNDGNLTSKTAVIMMIFALFHWPCATTVLTIKKETGSMKKTAAAVILPTAVGVILCLMINLLF